jgi:hypothetical protein
MTKHSHGTQLEEVEHLQIKFKLRRLNEHDKKAIMQYISNAFLVAKENDVGFKL